MTSGMLAERPPVVARPRSTRIAAAAGVLLASLGLLVLVGWFSHTLALVQVLPQLPPVRRNAAVCLALSGVALLGVALKGPGWIVIACTGLAGAVSVLTLVEYAFRVNLGIDELLGPNYITLVGATPARMTAVAAVCFASSSMTLLLALEAKSKWSTLLVVFDGSIIAAVGLATIMAYALGSSASYATLTSREREVTVRAAAASPSVQLLTAYGPRTIKESAAPLMLNGRPEVRGREPSRRAERPSGRHIRRGTRGGRSDSHTKRRRVE